MKYIFDFDDTLFDTAKFKELIFTTLLAYGTTSPDEIKASYDAERKSGPPFSLMNFLKKFNAEGEYMKIMSHCPYLLNTELIDAVRRLGKENCYIVTHGEREFQEAKIKESGIWNFFSLITTTAKGKKEQIEEVCKIYPNESVVFIDNNPKFISEPGLTSIPNLTTLLYKPGMISEIIEMGKLHNRASKIKKK